MSLDRKELNGYLCLILSALAASPRHEAPRGPIYAATLCAEGRLDDYQFIIGVAKRGGLLTEDGSHLLKLTPKGVALARQVDESLAAQARTIDARLTKGGRS